MPRDLEGPVQRSICSYLSNVLHPSVAQWFAIPNENDGSARMNSRLNAQGRKKGVADLCIVHDGRALFVEVKADAPHKGYQSPDQKAWEGSITTVGASYGIARSVDDVVSLLDLWGVPMRVRAVHVPHEGPVA